MTRNVLIVEDTELCRDTLEVALMKLPNLAVQSVTSAEEALEWLDANEACALVTDLHLPLMNGFELIEAVRGRPWRASLPILVISGDSDPRIPTRVAKLGANAFFSKPYSPAEVRHKLEQLIDAAG
ncbi:MAG TPA: response regulator [Bryobacteraceae bacterium]|jgi:DNA-binding response OmpR family regulator|nr:response regulator [Bryobacteraceae bacterium]